MSSNEEYLDSLLAAMMNPNTAEPEPEETSAVSDVEISAEIDEPEPEAERIPEEAQQEEPARPEIPEITPVSDDPHAQLTPDQIAAMFAQVDGGAEAQEEAPAEEYLDDFPELTQEDLSQEETSAMFGQISGGGSDTQDEAQEEVPEEEPARPEIPEITPVSDDPNAQLTPEQIAAMFAQADGGAETQEEAEKIQEDSGEETQEHTHVEDNKNLSQDEISAIIEQGPDEEQMQEPVTKPGDPDELLSPEQIAAMVDEANNRGGQKTDGEERSELSDIEELDMNDPDAIDKLLGLDAQGDMSAAEDEEEDVDIEAALKAAMESKEEAGLDASDMELSNLLSDLGDDDPELQEIGELLRKSDEHELVEDEMRALLDEQGAVPEEEEASEEKEGIDTGSFGPALGGGGGAGGSEPEEDAAQEAIRMVEQLEEEEEERERSKKEGKKKRGKKEKAAEEDGEEEQPKKGLKGLFAKKKKKKADQESEEEAGEVSHMDQMAELANMDFDGIPEEPEGMDDIAPAVGMGGASEGEETLEQAAERMKRDEEEVAAIPEKGASTPKGKESEEADEKGDKKKGKKKKGEDGEKKGLFAKLFAALTEEVEEEEEEPKPKKKKGKKGKVKDADDNEAILDELDGEAKGKMAKKPKKEKPKKEKKPKKPPKPKKEKKPKAPEEPVKKLPTKMVVLIFIMCISILALVLIFVLLIPPLFEVQSAKKAFKDKQYYEAYQGFIGKKLSEEEEKMFMKSRIVLKFQHKVEAYQHYVGMNMPVEALDSLIEGYMQYDDLAADIDHYEAGPEANAVKEQILTILQNQYHLDEAEIRRIYAQDDYNYTLELEHITGGLSRQNSNYDREANGGLSEIDVPEIDFNQVGAPEGGEAGGGADTDGGQQDLQDLLPEEEIE